MMQFTSLTSKDESHYKNVDIQLFTNLHMKDNLRKSKTDVLSNSEIKTNIQDIDLTLM